MQCKMAANSKNFKEYRKGKFGMSARELIYATPLASFELLSDGHKQKDGYEDEGNKTKENGNKFPSASSLSFCL